MGILAKTRGGEDLSDIKIYGDSSDLRGIAGIKAKNLSEIFE